MGASNLSKYGNFILQDEKKLLNLPSKTIDAVKMVENALELTETIDDRYISAAVESKSEYLDSIIPKKWLHSQKTAKERDMFKLSQLFKRVVCKAVHFQGL